MTTTRRDAAAAGPIPESPMPRPGRGEFSQGPLPAHRRRAVPTREYQCGGQPIHTVPARRPIPQAARPPPSSARPDRHPPSRSRAPARPACCPQPCHPPGKTVALTSRSISVGLCQVVSAGGGEEPLHVRAEPTCSACSPRVRCGRCGEVPSASRSQGQRNVCAARWSASRCWPSAPSAVARCDGAQKGVDTAAPSRADGRSRGRRREPGRR